MLSRFERHQAASYGAAAVPSKTMCRRTLTTPDGPERHRRFYLCPNRPINRVSLAMLDFQIQKTPLTIRHERAQSERTNLTTELQRGCTASAERMPSRDRAAVIKTIRERRGRPRNAIASTLGPRNILKKRTKNATVGAASAALIRPQRRRIRNVVGRVRLSP